MDIWPKSACFHSSLLIFNNSGSRNLPKENSVVLFLEFMAPIGTSPGGHPTSAPPFSQKTHTAPLDQICASTTSRDVSKKHQGQQAFNENTAQIGVFLIVTDISEQKDVQIGIEHNHTQRKFEVRNIMESPPTTLSEALFRSWMASSISL